MCLSTPKERRFSKEVTTRLHHDKVRRKLRKLEHFKISDTKASEGVEI